MSRGLGRVQRFILDELKRVAPKGVLLSDANLRRAGHGLANAGRVKLALRVIDSRERLVAYQATPNQEETT